jgi:sugar/nucleoside kinase (ribokinase family)
LSAIDFLAIGHVTRDRAPDGYRLGGTVTFAAVTAERLGHRPGVLTRASADQLRSILAPAGDATPLAPRFSGGASFRILPSETTTTFVNVYQEGRRHQIIEAWADPIEPDELPAVWAPTPIVLLGPVARELPTGWASRFPGATLGLTPQGWMRQWDASGRVSPCPWEDSDAFLARADATVISREDVGGDETAILSLAQRARVLVATDGWHGALVYEGDRRYRVPPRPAVEVDPTGAGDVFATSFVIRFHETGNPYQAARFANVMASMSIEGAGVAAIPEREQVEAYLHANG